MKIFKRFAAFISLLVALAIGFVFIVPKIIGVPKNNLPAGTQAKILQKLEGWDKEKPSYQGKMAAYDSVGDYLGYGNSACAPNQRNSMDAKGVLQRNVDGKTYYHPVLTAQCGLMAYGRWLGGDQQAKDQLVSNAENLLFLQDEAGAFRYPFPFRYYLTGETLPVGWVSGMAQGQALSLLSRAYKVTKDPRYIQAGRKALAFMQVSTDQGGVMTTLADLSPELKGHIFFEEYVSKPANYTLNGYIFALLGIYDWSMIDPAAQADQEQAKKLFAEGIESLKIVLPHYDLGKISAYDLGYMTHPRKLPHMAPRYHAVHIFLLNAVYSITADSEFSAYRDRWMLYMHPRVRSINAYLAKKNKNWPTLN